MPGRPTGLVDADLGDSAVELKRLLVPLADGRAAMTVARFPGDRRRRGGFGLVKRLAAWSIYRACGWAPLEPLSGQRVFRRELLNQLSFPPRGFGLEVALTMDLLGARSWKCPRRCRTAKGAGPAALCRGRQCAALLGLWRRRRLLKGGAR